MTTTIPTIDTAATLHVTLDALTAHLSRITTTPTADAPGNPGSPWMDYAGDDGDPLTTRAGYVAAVYAAIAATTDALNNDGRGVLDKLRDLVTHWEENPDGRDISEDVAALLAR